MVLSIEQFVQAFPRLSGELVDAYYPHLCNVLEAEDLTTPSRLSMFLAQLAHESCGLVCWRELGDVQKKRYYPWYGRGPIQLTWRANYEAFAAASGFDVVSNPDLLLAPPAGFASAGWFWRGRKLNALADAGDFDGISGRIHGCGKNPACACRGARKAVLRRVRMVLGT